MLSQIFYSALGSNGAHRDCGHARTLVWFRSSHPPLAPSKIGANGQTPSLEHPVLFTKPARDALHIRLYFLFTFINRRVSFAEVIRGSGKGARQGRFQDCVSFGQGANLTLRCVCMRLLFKKPLDPTPAKEIAH